MLIKYSFGAVTLGKGFNWLSWEWECFGFWTDSIVGFCVLRVISYATLGVRTIHSIQPRVELLSSTNEDCHTAPDFLIKLGWKLINPPLSVIGSINYLCFCFVEDIQQLFFRFPRENNGNGFGTEEDCLVVFIGIYWIKFRPSSKMNYFSSN